MNDQDVRDFLGRMAVEEPTPVLRSAPLARRARHRAARTVAIGAIGIAAAIAVMFAGVAETRTTSVPVDGPTPPVTPRPTTLFTERFDSPLNGLSIGYPAGWRTRTATEPWGHDAIAFDAPDVDVIFDPKFRDDLYLAVVSEPLGSTSPQDWVDHLIDNPSMGICYTGGAGGRGHGFQGNPAWFQDCDEPTGGGGNIAIFATPTRGYIIYFHVADEPRLQATYDAHWFWGRTGVLRTVELRAEDALDTSSPSGSP